MNRASSLKMLCIAICFCVAPAARGNEKTVGQGGVSLTYDAAIFSKVEIVELRKEPLPNPHDRLNVHPANLLFLFYVGSQYAGSSSFIR